MSKYLAFVALFEEITFYNYQTVVALMSSLNNFFEGHEKWKKKLPN
jgi:hypothetical protein